MNMPSKTNKDKFNRLADYLRSKIGKKIFKCELLSVEGNTGSSPNRIMITLKCFCGKVFHPAWDNFRYKPNCGCVYGAKEKGHPLYGWTKNEISAARSMMVSESHSREEVAAMLNMSLEKLEYIYPVSKKGALNTSRIVVPLKVFTPITIGTKVDGMEIIKYLGFIPHYEGYRKKYHMYLVRCVCGTEITKNHYQICNGVIKRCKSCTQKIKYHKAEDEKKITT